MARPHQRLDQAMNGRRIELDMRWTDVAARARVAEVTLRAIRNGSNKPSPLTARRIEDALRWQPGSIDTILAGGEPTPLPDWHLQKPPEPEPGDELARRPGESKDDYAERLIQRGLELLRERREAG